MKRIYMSQPNSVYGKSIYFPYAAGSLIAYAFADPTIRENYVFARFFYKKDSVSEVVSSMEEPYLMGFSCYVWNYEYNKKLAAAVKARWPECVIVFGGHQVSPKEDCMEDPNVDIAIFGEGEDCFKRVLLALAGLESLNEVPNIMYRENGRPVLTKRENLCIPQRRSPYTEGWFDRILREEKDYSFSAILETNRGCPNKCAFCDWGNIKSRVLLYDESLVKAEIDWFSENKIDYVYGADGNFGLFPRDEKFVDYLIQKNKETGFPVKFQTTFSKNNPEEVFILNKKLNDAGLSKGATISFQSLSEVVLENIYRKNMPLENFKQLMRLYNENGIAAYSEVILGLPGETYESFREGLELLLENGQHMSIVIFNLEMLSNSVMNSPAYIEKYQLRYSRIEQYQYHVVPDETSIKEFSRIVVSTSSMPGDKWIDSNILGIVVRAFHNLGLLQCFAIYLYYEKQIPYMSFYESLIRFAAEHPQTVVGRIYTWLRGRFEEIQRGEGGLTWQDDDFGKITWPFEESVFLMIVREIDAYREEILPFLMEFFADREDLFRDLLSYQNAVVKTPGLKERPLSLHYDWFSYFSDAYNIRYAGLRKKENTIVINPGRIPEALPAYAAETIWYGRKGGKNVITDIRYINGGEPDGKMEEESV